MPVVRGIRVLNAISTGNTTPGCLDTLLSDAGRLADVTQVLSSPQYACALSQSNTAAHTLVRSNNAMTALFANPTGSCIFYQTPNSRDDMLASSCYYNYMMSFSTPEATCAFTNLGNSPCMLNCAFASCTAFLSQATSSNTEIAKILSCNACVRACFIGTAQSKQEALGTPGRPAYWLSDATAFTYLTCTMLDTAFANTVFLETLNRDIACVMCTPAFNCCAWGTAAGANTYTNSPCAINEVVNKGACCLNFTSCNFRCWFSSCYGVTCLTAKLATGNTYFIDQINALGSFRQRACLYDLCENNTDCYYACCGNPGATTAQNAHKLLKTEIIARGGYSANNANLPLVQWHHTSGQRICPMTIANGSQLSNTEVEYIGRFGKCNYNVITHADCRFTLISPGFWNQSSGIACFKSCYCCALDRTTANTSGLTINCSLYYTTDNAASFNRLCYCIPACIFQQLCGNCCCQFAVRYGLSSFACCNYVYTGWIISDCGTTSGACCTPAYFKTGHSRVCLHSANSQPNYDTWTHFPDVPLPFYTIAFCDDYFAGVSPMRTDGYQTTLRTCNTICCQCMGQWALMFSFGKVGDCVRVSCDNFVTCTPTTVCCFTPTTCCQACRSLPAVTSETWNTCLEDYFQGHGSGSTHYCLYSPHQGVNETSNGMTCRINVNSAATSHTLIYKNPTDQTDSKAFLVGWRSFAMMYGGPVGASTAVCGVVAPARCGQYMYNCCNCRGMSESLPYGCGYFSNSPGVNVWCYGAQANNTMQGSEIVCTALGGDVSASWTNFTFSNARIVGNRLVLSGSMPPRITLCALCSSATSCASGTGLGVARTAVEGQYGCQNDFGQIGHTTLFNTNGVVGTYVCCLDAMYHQTPHNNNNDATFEQATYWCNWVVGTCGCCVDNCCTGLSQPGGAYTSATPYISDTAGLKTINLYGSSNSIYSFAAFPNMPPVVTCKKGCSVHSASTTCLTCYTSIAATAGDVPMRSDQSMWCPKDLGDACVYQFDDSTCLFGRFGAQFDGQWHNCNPGFANSVGMTYAAHIYSGSWSPREYFGVYVPPSANQDTTLYNFCYVLTPHHDLCLEGPFCFNRACECFGPNCCLTVPCSPCCPNCNLIRCCVCGYWGGVICNYCICCITRANGYVRQNLRVNCSLDGFPCCQTPPRFCCPSIGGCIGWGNHHLTTAAANNTFQCAQAMGTFPYQCGNDCQCFSCDGHCSGCQCYTYFRIGEYSTTIRTCNQSGPNCMWYDYMMSTSMIFCKNACPGHLPCKSFWNSQYTMDNCLNRCRLSYCEQGLAYMVSDDSKKAGFHLLPASGCTCMTICVDSKCFPIVYSRLTRGSGGYLNTQNSVHVAYFDLVPFRCTLPSGASGFYANGNACPGPSGTVCCLMYVKQDIFFNVG